MELLAPATEPPWPPGARSPKQTTVYAHHASSPAAVTELLQALERKPMSPTHAALRHLEDLHAQLASLQCGQGPPQHEALQAALANVEGLAEQVDRLAEQAVTWQTQLDELLDTPPPALAVVTNACTAATQTDASTAAPSRAAARASGSPLLSIAEEDEEAEELAGLEPEGTGGVGTYGFLMSSADGGGDEAAVQMEEVTTVSLAEINGLESETHITAAAHQQLQEQLAAADALAFCAQAEVCSSVARLAR